MDPAEFDFSLISGESAGVTLEAGQVVGAGAKLVSPQVRLSVPPTGRSSLIENIIESTIAAFNTRKDQASLGDRISAVFVPIVFALTGAVFLFSLVQHDFEQAFIRSLSMLVVACPCAFGIAEPLVLTAGIDWIRSIGIQIFNGNVLSRLPDLVVFDKTGTLTRGMLQVRSIHWCVEEDPALLDILATLETGVEHPIARSLALLGQSLTLESRQVHRDHIQATFQGRTYQAGSTRLYPEVAIPPALSESTLVLFGTERECCAIIELADALKPESAALVQNLQSQGIEVTICSGDRRPVVNRIARALGITDAQAQMTSADKMQFIQDRQAAGRHIMMVGDGINDAQALSRADFGLAVFSGQLPAKMSSDGCFLTKDIGPLTDLLRIMRRIRRKIVMNYAWSFLYNVVGLGLAALGWLSPTYCAFGMVFSNFVVIFNSMVRVKGKAVESRK
jgi:P-type E1-E2 ATPase